VHFKEFNSDIKTIYPTLIHLIKSHIQFNSTLMINPKLILNGIELIDKKMH